MTEKLYIKIMQTDFFDTRQLSFSNRLLYLGTMVLIVCSVLGFYYKAIGQPGLLSFVLRVEAIGGVLILYYAYNKHHSLHTQGTIRWTFLIFAYMLMELFNAMLFAKYREDYFDIVLWIFFVAMFYLGSSPNYWKYYLRWGLFAMIIASFLSLSELLFGGFSYLRGQWDEDSYLYSLQIGFIPVPLFLCYYILNQKKKYYTLFSIFIFLFYVILQFIFQKRLPLLRIVIIIVALFYILRARYSLAKRTRMATLLLIAVIISIVFLVPRQYYTATSQRFFQHGTAEQTVQQDERYLILDRAMEVTFDSPRTVFLGQGLGGVVPGYFYGKTVTVNGREMDGLSGFEIGAATLWFKYGIFFVLIIYGFMAKLLLRYRDYKKDPIALSCWLYLLVFFIMNFIGESFVSTHTVITTATLAPSMGYLSTFKKTNKKYEDK